MQVKLDHMTSVDVAAYSFPFAAVFSNPWGQTIWFINQTFLEIKKSSLFTPNTAYFLISFSIAATWIKMFDMAKDKSDLYDDYNRFLIRLINLQYQL